MIFISLINVLNVSIILMTIIALSNSEDKKISVPVPAIQLYQLPIKADVDYEFYTDRKMDPHEKKMSFDNFLETTHNIYARIIPLPDSNYSTFYIAFEKYCEKEYKYSEYAVDTYYNNEIERNINKFKDCLGDKSLSALKEIITDEYIKNIERDSDNGCFPCNVFNPNKKYSNFIKLIDKKLSGDLKVTNFYKCIVDFHNDMFKFQNACESNLTKKIDIEIDENKNLDDKDKLKVASEIKFKLLKVITGTGQNKQMSENVSTLFKKYCNRVFYARGNRKYVDMARKNCLDELRYKMQEWEFNLIKISYKFIYPLQINESLDQSLEQSFDTFKQNRKTIINILKKLDKDNESLNKLYTDLETANDEVDLKYYEMMLECRAIWEEHKYEHYVMRLHNIGCIPLCESMWSKERINTKKDNVAAKTVLEWKNKNKNEKNLL